MPLKRRLFNKVTIIGVGLIGGSMGKAIKKHNLAREVVGLSQRHASLVTALKNEAIDHAYQDIKKAVTNADLVIISTPVSIVLGMLSMIGPHIKRNCIVTDVGSTKMSIVNFAKKHLKGYPYFVGSHPLVGSEKKGVQYANADLFKKGVCIMTPTEETNRSSCEKVKRLWVELGCEVKMLSPEEHDRVLGYISHLPHLIAYALMGAIPPETLCYSPQGLKDTTRIAGSAPQMWNDICMSNPKNLINGLDEVVKILSNIRKAVSSNDSQSLMSIFKSAKEKRDKIS